MACALLLPSGSGAAGDGPCPLPPAAREAHPRRILAPEQHPWSLRPLPDPPDPPTAATLPPAGNTDRLRLIRRLTFVLTGLPPRADDAAAFIGDESPKALEKAIDRLQASPAAAEWLAQWWLGLVGYLDHWTTVPRGSPQPVHAWRYRDWLIESFEKATRLGPFVRLHLIGDILPGPEPGVPNRAGLTATTWYVFGPPPRGDLAEASSALALHQAGQTARVFLGADFSCARCHDHPSLPLRAPEHAAWVSIFAQSHSLIPGTDGSPALPDVPTISENRLAQRTRELAAIAALEHKRASDHRRFSITAASEFLPQTAEYVRAAWNWHQQQPEARPTIEAFCAKRGLLPAPLHRWVSALGLAEPSSPASSQPWWNDWVQARDSADPGRIATAAQQIQNAHQADESSPFFDLSPDALKRLTLDQQTQLSKLQSRIATLHHRLTSDQAVHALAQGPAATAPPPTPAPQLPALLPGAPGTASIPPASGRLALAEWLDGPGRPLLARLLVHRLWVACGQSPLVGDDLAWWRPEPPTGASQIDPLAAALDAEDGSFAPVQKRILLGAPGGPPLTLSENERRDAVLFVSGQLDPRRHGPPDPSPESHRRTLYRVWTEPRKPVPLLGSFLQTQAEATVKLAHDTAGPSPTAQTSWLTHRVLQRPPTGQELRELGDAPDRGALVAFCLTLFQSDEFRVLR